MKAVSFLVAFTIAICGLLSIDLPVSAAAAEITGTWELTVHYPPPGDPYTAT